MPRRLTLPDTASVATPLDDGRMFAPSAARNVDAICDLLGAHTPPSGRALELASGTGQHAAAFAQRFTGITWQPSEVDPERRQSIDAYAAQSGLPNFQRAIALDATTPGWGRENSDNDLIVTVNLLHLISEAEAQTLIAEATTALAPNGILVLYGPFLRDGETTSDGDARFHQDLTRQDPDIGYKDDWDVIEWLQANFLDLVEVVEMPANNLAFVARKP